MRKDLFRHRGVLLASTAFLFALTVRADANTLDLGSLESLFDQPITTSVTGMPMRESDVPASIEIITADEIRRTGALDIPTVLKRYAGIDFRQWTDSHYDIGVRGYNQPYNPRLLVLINGRQVYLDHYGMTAWTALPVQMDDIRQIEIVRGPNTALFGFNAASGVVNIVTFNPIYDDIGTVRVSATDSGLDTSATASMRLPDSYGIMLSAGVRNEDSFDADGVGPDALFEKDPERKNVSINSVIQLGQSTQLELDGSHVAAELNELDPLYLISRTRYSNGSVRARLFHDTDYGLWKFNAYHNHLAAELDSAATFQVTGRSVEARNDVTVIGAENQLIPAPGHALRLGAEYRRNMFSSVFSGKTDVGYEVAALSGTWHWQASEDLSMIASARIDRLETFADGPPLAPYQGDDYKNLYYEPSYNLGIQYDLTEKDRLSLLGARGVQTASLLELSFIFPPSAVNGFIPVVADPRLKPTVVDSIEIDYERDIDFLSGRLNLSAFAQEHRNLKTVPGLGPSNVAFVNGAPVITTFNAGDSKSWGFEAAFDGELEENWHYGLSYSYIDMDDDLTLNQVNIEQPVKFEGSTPAHMVKGQLGYEDGPFSADLFLHWSSEYEVLENPNGTGFDVAEVDSDINADARIAYDLDDNTEISIAGFNLLGKYDTGTGLEIDQRFIATVKFKLN
ncbi:MAG: TonB-dependent receptor [Geminicoccaceae bacterium]